MTAPGEIVDVVLDAETLDDGSTRVLLQGVFPHGALRPPPLTDDRPHVVSVHRNVVQVFYGHDMRSVSAFRIFPDSGAPS